MGFRHTQRAISGRLSFEEGEWDLSGYEIEAGDGRGLASVRGFGSATGQRGVRALGT